MNESHRQTIKTKVAQAIAELKRIGKPVNALAVSKMTGIPLPHVYLCSLIRPYVRGWTSRKRIATVAHPITPLKPVITASKQAIPTQQVLPAPEKPYMMIYQFPWRNSLVVVEHSSDANIDDLENLIEDLDFIKKSIERKIARKKKCEDTPKAV